MTQSDATSWKIYHGDGEYRAGQSMPEAPAWRQFRDDPDDLEHHQKVKGQTFVPPPEAVEMVNAAISLRRPLLITGNPGTGKSSLAYAVAEELQLGSVLKWAITTRSTLKDGLYDYDAIARLQDAQASKTDNRQDTGNYITLGALGTAFLAKDRPRVLLIDEIDKSDIDLPNDLLNLFEDGYFPIRELQRLDIPTTQVRCIDRDPDGKQRKVPVINGVVRCRAFPLVIMTSNGERDFPPPFLRRCLRLRMPNPGQKELELIVERHLGGTSVEQSKRLIEWFCRQIEDGRTLATDQLLNAIHIRTQEKARVGQSSPEPTPSDEPRTLTLSELEQRLLKDLNSPEEV